jgi:hypothetical protein
LLAEIGELGEPVAEQPVTSAASAAQEVKRREEDAMGFTSASMFGEIIARSAALHALRIEFLAICRWLGRLALGVL